MRASEPQMMVISKLCDHGYDSKARGVNWVFPGLMRTRSSPVKRKIGHNKSRPNAAAMNRARETRGSRDLATNATAVCPTNMATEGTCKGIRQPESALALAVQRRPSDTREVAGASRAAPVADRPICQMSQFQIRSYRLGAGAAGSMLRMAAMRHPLLVFFMMSVAHMLRLVPPAKPESS